MASALSRFVWFKEVPVGAGVLDRPHKNTPHKGGDEDWTVQNSDFGRGELVLLSAYRHHPKH